MCGRFQILPLFHLTRLATFAFNLNFLIDLRLNERPKDDEEKYKQSRRAQYDIYLIVDD